MKKYDSIKQAYTKAFEAVEMLELKYGPEMLYAYAFVQFNVGIKDYLDGKFTEEEDEEISNLAILAAIAIDEFAEKFSIDTKEVLRKYGIVEDKFG